MVPVHWIYTLTPSGPGCCPFKPVVLVLLIYCLLLLPLLVVALCLILVLVYVTVCPSSFAIIMMGKREMVLSIWCIVTVSVRWPFLKVSWVGLHCVIVVFPEHSHLLFCSVYLSTMFRQNKTHTMVSACAAKDFQKSQKMGHFRKFVE